MLGSNRFSQALLKKFNSCLTETQCVSTSHNNRLMLLRKINALWRQNKLKQRNDTTLYDKKKTRSFYILTLIVLMWRIG